MILTSWFGDGWFQIATEREISLTWMSGRLSARNLNTCNDCRAGLGTGGGKSVPTVCVLPRGYLRRPVEYTHNLPNACLTGKKKATSLWTVEALTDEGRPSPFLATGQDSCIQASQPTNLLLSHACTKNYDVPRRDTPTPHSAPSPHTLPHHASEGQEREPRACKRSGRRVRKLFTGGTARRSKAISPYLPPPPPRALGKGGLPSTGPPLSLVQ